MIVYKEISLLPLLGLFSLALGLSLDTLPHRLQAPATSKLNSLSREQRNRLLDLEDFDNNFVHESHSKRKIPGISAISHSPAKSGHKRPVFEIGYPPLHSFRDHTKIKRKAEEKNVADGKKEEVGRDELANILKDDESDKTVLRRERKIAPDTKRQESLKKTKRESEETPDKTLIKDNKSEEKERKHNDFQEWLQREYYRNMAKSFASMRRKRAMWGPVEPESQSEDEEQEERRRLLTQMRSENMPRTPKKENRFDEVTSSLKSIEDALLSDALHVIKDGGNSYEGDYSRRQRVSNDLNAAYDIETMRSALFRLRDTLYSMEEESIPEQEFYPNNEIYPKYSKRGENQCPPLSVLTSDCSVLKNVEMDDALRDLLTHACNWHEVCYTCGEVFGLSSDNCDMGFVEQSRTICRGDVPCESTARLLILPLRQSRVFYKRSNPSVCLVDPCVEEYLSKG